MQPAVPSPSQSPTDAWCLPTARNEVRACAIGQWQSECMGEVGKPGDTVPAGDQTALPEHVGPAPHPPEGDWFNGLRGLFRGLYDDAGGGEAYLRRERAAWGRPRATYSLAGPPELKSAPVPPAAQAVPLITTLGDYASVAGVAIALVGFVLTLRSVHGSKKAADAARTAAEGARRDIFRSSAMIELSGAAAAMEEIKRLHREGEWRALLPRYSTLRSTLIGIHEARQILSEGHKAALQGAITQLRVLEQEVDRALAESNEESLDPAGLNALITEQMDRLSAALGELRSQTNG
jgi:hypothetical protein